MRNMLIGFAVALVLGSLAGIHHSGEGRLMGEKIVIDEAGVKRLSCTYFTGFGTFEKRYRWGWTAFQGTSECPDTVKVERTHTKRS